MFENKGPGPLAEKFGQIIHNLESNLSILSARILKSRQDGEVLKSNHMIGCLCPHADVFSFNPGILRSRDAYYMAKVFNVHYKNNLGVHIERFATEALRQLSPSPNPFSHVQYDWLSCLHIGEPNFDPAKQY